MKAFTNQTVGRGMAGWTAGLGLVFAALLLPVISLPAATAFSPATSLIRLAPGVTSREIQQALNSLPPAGGEVWLPAGQFKIVSPIVLRRSHQTLRGAGDATLLQLVAGADCPVIIMGEPVNHPLHTVTHLQVIGVQIDGNRTRQDRELWRLTGEGSEIRNNGITIQDVSDSLVEHVTCADCRSGGLVTTLGVTRLTVRGLSAYGNEFDGLACYLTTDSLFADLNLHDNPGAGISLDLSFDRNVISNASLTRNDLGIFMRASRNNQFHNITISNSHHFGVFMAQADLSTPAGVQAAPATECTRNSFTNLAAVECGSAAFRVNDLTCTNNVIIQPRFTVTAKGGLSEVGPNLVSVQ